MNAIYSRRSIRKFLDTPLTKEELEQIIRAGMAAACAKNSQNRLFFVQEGLGTLPSLIEAHSQAFALKTATASIVVATDLKKAAEIDAGNPWWIQDCSASIQNMMVQAADLGLGTLWVGVYPDPKRIVAVRKDLDLPEHIMPLGVIAIGHPAATKDPIDRYEPEKVFFGKYQTQQ